MKFLTIFAAFFFATASAASLRATSKDQIDTVVRVHFENGPAADQQKPVSAHDAELHTKIENLQERIRFLDYYYRAYLQETTGQAQPIQEPVMPHAANLETEVEYLEERVQFLDYYYRAYQQMHSQKGLRGNNKLNDASGVAETA